MGVDGAKAWLERHREHGPLFIRLVVGARLIWGTQDNVLSWERMREFAAFLQQHGVPQPLPLAVLSVAAQFLGGILVTLGLWTRAAGALIALHFVAALWIAHRGDTFLNMYDALVMLAAGVFLLLHGPGKLSVDGLRRAGAAHRGAETSAPARSGPSPEGEALP